MSISYTGKLCFYMGTTSESLYLIKGYDKSQGFFVKKYFSKKNREKNNRSNEFFAKPERIKLLWFQEDERFLLTHTIVGDNVLGKIQDIYVDSKDLEGAKVYTNYVNFVTDNSEMLTLRFDEFERVAQPI